MIELKRTESAEPVEMVDFITIDDVVYQVPAKPKLAIALQFLDDTRRRGSVLAEMILLEKMVGEKGYKAICEFEDIQPEDMRKIMNALADTVLGVLEESPNSDSGSPRSDGS